MIDISFSVDCENEADVQAVIEKVALCALQHENMRASVNITVVSESEIQRLNREFRNTDRVTDVLSFPACDGSCFDVTDGFLGDIAICMEKAKQQAQEYGHSLNREFAFLTVHGMLHIMGYDHIEKQDELVMFALQNEILNSLGILR